MISLVRKLGKAARLLADQRFRKGLLQGVAATIEHHDVFINRPFSSIVDVGANRGQFALLMSGLYPEARIIAFEPLAEPYRKLMNVIADRPKLRAFNAAIGPDRTTMPMNVSKRDDSSSLLPISKMQEKVFPNTGHARIDHVRVAPLGDFIGELDLAQPSLLKIDVQGFELEVLRGSADCLDRFSSIYVEASFIELYEGQALASDIIDYLHDRGFRLQGIYNLCQMRDGRAVQADFLFDRRSSDQTNALESSNRHQDSATRQDGASKSVA